VPKWFPPRTAAKHVPCFFARAIHTSSVSRQIRTPIALWPSTSKNVSALFKISMCASLSTTPLASRFA
jgi:hypothetical protein